MKTASTLFGVLTYSVRFSSVQCGLAERDCDHVIPSSENSASPSVETVVMAVVAVLQLIDKLTGGEEKETSVLRSSANVAPSGRPVQMKHAFSSPVLRARRVISVGQTTPFVVAFAPHISPSMETSVSPSVAARETTVSTPMPRKRFMSSSWLAALSSAVSTLL